MAILMGENVTLYIALGAFALNMIGTIVGVTWKLSRVEVSLRETIMTERKEIDHDMERQSREFGETVNAIRTKVHEVEVYVRDTYVRGDGFFQVKNELAADIKSLGVQINARLERMEAQIATKS